MHVATNEKVWILVSQPVSYWQGLKPCLCKTRTSLSLCTTRNNPILSYTRHLAEILKIPVGTWSGIIVSSLVWSDKVWQESSQGRPTPWAIGHSYHGAHKGHMIICISMEVSHYTPDGALPGIPQQSFCWWPPQAAGQGLGPTCPR